MDVPRFGSLPGLGAMLAAAGLPGGAARPLPRRAPEVAADPPIPDKAPVLPVRRHLHPPRRSTSRPSTRRLLDA
jgi:hypothetical protein